jgi:hypothetical protein
MTNFAATGVCVRVCVYGGRTRTIKVCKIEKNVFGKYVHHKLAYSFPLIFPKAKLICMLQRRQHAAACWPSHVQLRRKSF